MDQIELGRIAKERKAKLERIDQLMTEIVRVGREITMRTSRNVELANQAKALDVPVSPSSIRERLQRASKEFKRIKRTGQVVHHKLKGNRRRNRSRPSTRRTGCSYRPHP
jgi:hypothetical protein